MSAKEHTHRSNRINLLPAQATSDSSDSGRALKRLKDSKLFIYWTKTRLHRKFLKVWFHIKMVNTFKRDSVWRAWTWAIKNNDIELLDDMTQHNFFPAQRVEGRLNQLLFDVMKFKDGRLVKHLLRAGANPNAISAGKLRQAPTHCAIRHGNAIALSALISAGADLSICDQLGDTPLLAALDFRGHVSFGFRLMATVDERWAMAKTCLDEGADIRAVNHDGRSVLDYALEENAETARWAISAGATVAHPQDALVDVLWKSAALENVRQQFEKGYKRERWALVDVLLTLMGANFEEPDSDGHNPISRGQIMGRMTPEDVKPLQQRGAKVLSIFYDPTGFDAQKH